MTGTALPSCSTLCSLALLCALCSVWNADYLQDVSRSQCSYDNVNEDSSLLQVSVAESWRRSSQSRNQGLVASDVAVSARSVARTDNVWRLLSVADPWTCLQGSGGSGKVQMAKCQSREDAPGQFWALPAAPELGDKVFRIHLAQNHSVCLAVKEKTLTLEACSSGVASVTWSWAAPIGGFSASGYFLKHAGTGHCLSQNQSLPLTSCPDVFSSRKALLQWLALPDAQRVPMAELPLRVSGAHLIGASGRIVKLRGVNWYGAHMEQHVNNGLDRITVKDMAQVLLNMGFNMVRMSFGTDEFINDPEVDHKLLTANPELKGMKSKEIFRHCVNVLTDAGLLVVLNNHVTVSKWCCDLDDTNSVWFNKQRNESMWLRVLQDTSKLFKDNKRVIGMDLRNEPRPDVQDVMHVYMVWWGKHFLGRNRSAIDWRAGATEGAKAVWHGDAEALVFVEGVMAVELLRVISDRMDFNQSCLHSRVVYSVHDYEWFTPWTDLFANNNFDKSWRAETGLQSLKRLAKTLVRYAGKEVTQLNLNETSLRHESDRLWGYLPKSNLAPVWVGEFGTSSRSAWWKFFVNYSAELDLDWSYWAVDGYKWPAHYHKAKDVDETFGLLSVDFRSIRMPFVLRDLAPLLATAGVRDVSPAKGAHLEQCEFDPTLNPVHGTGGYSAAEPLTEVLIHIVHDAVEEAVGPDVTSAVKDILRVLKRLR